MKVTESVSYIGVDDRNIDLFEGQYKVPNGMCYNSYIIFDEKIAVMDTVDQNFTKEWLDNLSNALDGKNPDYLVVHHMEPDHSANIINFMDKYPNTIVVSSDKAFNMMKNFFGTDFSNNRIVVNDGYTLDLGNHKLTFITAPMVHWPEVILSYDSYDKVLYSADCFGKFGTINANEEWIDEARRYYIGIVGKYGVQVQNLLKKTSNIDVQIICPLHGPILKDNLSYYLDLYNTWSSYASESKGILVAYTSVYGNTKKAAELLVQNLKDNGCEDAVLCDVSRCDMAEAVSNAFKYENIVFATTTYNADIFPSMKEFINSLIERNFQNKKVGFVENGSWAPMASKIMKGMLENSKNITFAETNVRILSAIDANAKEQIEALASEFYSNK